MAIGALAGGDAQAAEQCLASGGVLPPAVLLAQLEVVPREAQRGIDAAGPTEEAGPANSVQTVQMGSIMVDAQLPRVGLGEVVVRAPAVASEIGHPGDARQSVDDVRVVFRLPGPVEGLPGRLTRVPQVAEHDLQYRSVAQRETCRDRALRVLEGDDT